VNSHAKCLVFQTFSLFSISKKMKATGRSSDLGVRVFIQLHIFFFFFFFFS